ncbi:MAG TPA: hypothetical protein VEU50_21450 [Archangium sp.]|nr:hypothetical protein [Archangium sp.]
MSPVVDSAEVGKVAQKIVLRGSGVLIDNGSGRITYTVVPTYDNNKAQFVLRTVNSITWWKSLDIFLSNGSSYARIETKDGKHEAQVDFFATDMTTPYKVQFWKAGFLGAGAFVHEFYMDRDTSVGYKYIFTWERD